MVFSCWVSFIKMSIIVIANTEEKMIWGTGENDILFYFGNQANDGTGIPRKGLVTDLVTPPAFISYP